MLCLCFTSHFLISHLYDLILAARSNYQKYKRSIVYSMGVPYDYLSVSHYRKDQYASGVTQIETLDKKYQDIIGTTKELSVLDVKQLSLMYRCDGKVNYRIVFFQIHCVSVNMKNTSTVSQTLREICPNTEFFLVRIFPHSDWIQRDTPYLSVFSPNVGKYGPEKTPYSDTFHAVKIFENIF